jgi:hypothetical protein
MGVFWRSRSGRVFAQSLFEKLEPRQLLTAATFTGSTFTVGTGDPYSVQVADVNGDGKQDIVTANFNGTVTVLLGNGNATFGEPMVFSDGLKNGATSLAVADLNNDGLPDIVVSSRGQVGDIAVLLNQGGGNFGPPTLLPLAGNETDSVVVADINGDNLPDILASNGYGVLSVLLNKGNGKFRHYSALPLPNATGQNFLAVGDFNNDGKPDLAVANGFGFVQILLGAGNGTFDLASDNAVGSDPVSIAVADFNHDGNQDIVTGDNDGTVDVLLGNGNGTFQNATSTYIAQQVEGVAAGDLNGDGLPDIVVTSHAYYGYGYVGVLINNGNGTFANAASYSTPTKFPQGVAIGDFTNDGLNDVVSTDPTYAAVEVLTNTTTIPLAITSANNATFKVGTTSSFTVTGTGSPLPTMLESGALPAGLTFQANQSGTATFSGDPGYGSGGTYFITLSAKNGNPPRTTQAFTLVVDQAPAVTSAPTTTFDVGAGGKFVVTTEGYPTATIKEVGSLPDGVVFVDKGNGKAKLKGTPAPGTAETYPILIKAGNGVQPKAKQSFTLVVAAAVPATSPQTPSDFLNDTMGADSMFAANYLLASAGSDTILGSS